MSIMKSGLSIQRDALQGMLYSADRESSRNLLKTKLKSDAKQSLISTAGSAVGLGVYGMVEANKRGWFDEIKKGLGNLFSMEDDANDR